MHTRHERVTKMTGRRAVAALLVAGAIVGLVLVEIRASEEGGKSGPGVTEAGDIVQADTTVKYLVSCATAFRMQASADFAETVKNFEAQSAFAFITGSKSFADSPLAWEYFFSAAIPMVGRVDASAYAIAYYNPFLDAAIFTRWEMVEGPRARLSAASLMMGAQLAVDKRPESPGPPRWLTAEKPPAIGLTEQYAAFQSEFVRQFPPHGTARWLSVAATPPDLVDNMAVQITVTLVQLYAFQRRVDSQVVKLLDEFRTALYDGDAETLARLLPEESILPGSQLAALPTQFREQAVALCPLASDDEVMLILSDPNLLRFCGVLRYSITPPGKLIDFSMFDMQSSSLDDSIKKANQGNQP